MNNMLYDTNRTATYELVSNNKLSSIGNPDSLTAFNNNGFNLGGDIAVNNLNDTYVSWTFRKAPRFFDIVTYTGNGVLGRNIAHELGVAPGVIIIKSLESSVKDWPVFHVGNDAGNLESPINQRLLLNDNEASLNVDWWNDTMPSSSLFAVSNTAIVNDSGELYIAYLFANDSSPDSLIKCGNYRGNGLPNGPFVNLGWEPQFLIIKTYENQGQWLMYDNARDTSNLRTHTLQANADNVEATTGNDVEFTSTGFNVPSAVDLRYYCYIAIRAAA